MENFATTGLVPLIPYIGGIVGGIYGGPAGAAAGGAAGQEGVDYFGGNSKARTGKGITDSLFGGAGKGMMASGGYNSMGGMDGIQGLFGGGGSGYASPNDYMGQSGLDAGQFSGSNFQSPSSSGFNLGDITNYGSKLANLLGNNSGSSNNSSVGNSMGKTAQSPILTATLQPPVQPAFYPSKQDAPIQDTKNLELIALIDALRGQNG